VSVGWEHVTGSHTVRVTFSFTMTLADVRVTAVFVVLIIKTIQPMYCYDYVSFLDQGNRTFRSVRSKNARREEEVHLYLFTYLFTPWSTVLLEKLTVLKLVKKFPAFY
jgi:hypothetical protein